MSNEISEKTYNRFLRRYKNVLTDTMTEGFQVCGITSKDQHGKIVISCLYQKFGGMVSKSFFYNRVKHD